MGKQEKAQAVNTAPTMTKQEAREKLESMPPLPLKQKVGFTFDGLANVWMMTIPMFLMTFATESLGIAVGVVGITMMLVKVLDAFTDFFAGIMIDHTKSKAGKARPWLLWIAAPYAITLAAVFYIPESANMMVKIVLLAILYALSISVFGTIISVARMVLMTRMTDKPAERGQLGVLNDGISSILCGLLMSLTNVWALRFGYAKVFTVYGIIAFVACLIAYALCRENVGPLLDVLSGQEKKSATMKDLFKALFTNKYSLALLIYIILLNLANTIIQTGGIYYATNVLGDQVLYSKFMIFMVIGSVIGFVVATPLVHKIGSRNIFLLGSIMAACAAAVMFFSGGRSFAVICICIMVVAIGGITFTTTQIMAMTGDCVDYGEWKTGTRAEGVISSVSSIGVKIGGALGSAVLSGVMVIGGYVSGAETQTASAVSAINFAFTGMPMIMYIAIAVIYAITWRMEGQREQMRKETMERRMENKDRW